MIIINSQEVNQLIEIIRNDTIRKGDILCDIIYDDIKYEIDMQMNCKYKFWPDHIHFMSIVSRLSIGDTLKLHIRRKCDKEYCFKYIDIKLMENKNIFREMYSEVERIPYLALAGLFVMPLLYNHMSIFKKQNI